MGTLIILQGRGRARLPPRDRQAQTWPDSPEVVGKDPNKKESFLAPSLILRLFLPGFFASGQENRHKLRKKIGETSQKLFKVIPQQ